MDRGLTVDRGPWTVDQYSYLRGYVEFQGYQEEGSIHGRLRTVARDDLVFRYPSEEDMAAPVWSVGNTCLVAGTRYAAVDKATSPDGIS